MKSGKWNFILVEDDEVDALSLQREARNQDLDGSITLARDGNCALGLLVECEGPTILITDINLPGLSGHELIEAIRQEPLSKNSVVFVISSSRAASDIDRAYSNHVAGYIVKDP